jgi:hypothetical protein
MEMQNKNIDITARCYGHRRAERVASVERFKIVQVAFSAMELLLTAKTQKNQ